jgi:hypothetical protein
MSFDGFQITLRAPRAGGNHYVALEPSVLHEFERYVKRLRTTDSSSGEPA